MAAWGLTVVNIGGLMRHESKSGLGSGPRHGGCRDQTARGWLDRLRRHHRRIGLLPRMRQCVDIVSWLEGPGVTGSSGARVAGLAQAQAGAMAMP